MMTFADRAARERQWQAFYRRPHTLAPSPFCRSILPDALQYAAIVDLGCGNGRDSLFLAARGLFTIGMDLSARAIAVGAGEARARGLQEKTGFLTGDMADLADVRRAVGLARQATGDGRPVMFYSRFTLHALDGSQEQAFLSALSDCMRPGEKLCLEFRSTGDEQLPKHYPDHYRRYTDPGVLQGKLVNGPAFSVEYCRTGKGMARYAGEDPIVTRLVASKD